MPRLSLLFLWKRRLLPLSLLLLVSCTQAAFSAPQQPGASGKATSSPPLPTVAVTVAASLLPLPSGPGVGVNDPVVKNADADTAAFGAGCARWLQFTFGDYPQLGQTPRLSSQGRTRQELGLTDLRLTPAQAMRFGRLTGYTHMAVGTITGTSAHCTLTYQLYAVPTSARVGAPLRASGSPERVIAALPHLLEQMLTSLKLGRVSRAAPPTLTPTQMRCVGRYAWWQADTISLPNQQEMDALAMQQPLAGFLTLLHQRPQDGPPLETTARRLLAQAPRNLAARAQIAWVWEALPPAFQEELSRSLPSAANNYFVAMCQYVSRHTPQETITSAERLVRCAPRDPTAWLILAREYRRAAEQVRQGHTVDRISEAEWKTLRQLYDHGLAAARQATDLDGLYGEAWMEVAFAATFASQPRVADDALWKAMRLDPGNAQVYTWGLQMYQPKWFGDAGKLAKVVQRAVQAKGLTPDGDYAVYAALEQGNWDAEARIVYARAMAGSREAVRRYPQSAEAHLGLARLFIAQDKFAEALPEGQATIRLSPTSVQGHFYLGYAYRLTGHPEEALKEFRETLRLDLRHYNALLNIAFMMRGQGKMAEAEDIYRQVLQIKPDLHHARVALGFVLYKQRKYDTALVEYGTVIRLAPEYAAAYYYRSGAYSMLHQYAQAVADAKRALVLTPEDPEAHFFLGFAYVGQENNVEAAEEFRAALRLNPKDAFSHLELGRALLKLNQKAEAEAELKLVLSLRPGEEPAREAQQLLDQPR